MIYFLPHLILSSFADSTVTRIAAWLRDVGLTAKSVS